MPRFIVLEHTGAPDDPAGLHYDLLLEDGAACRTWRLATLPEPGCPPIAAIELPPHRLAWLDHESGAVSGGRGFARRVAAGTFSFVAGGDVDAFSVDVVGEQFTGRLFVLRTDGAWAVRRDASHAGLTGS